MVDHKTSSKDGHSKKKRLRCFINHTMTQRTREAYVHAVMTAETMSRCLNHVRHYTSTK